jgi:hypothetical protein
MKNNALPTQSNKTLFKATGFAAILAVIVLVLIILPTEYNIDPTGFGKMSGLSQLYSTEDTAEIKQTLTADNPKAQQDTVTIEVLPGEGLEYKFFLEAQQKLVYSWNTNGESLYFDFHGEPQGDTTGFFESFTIATSNKMNGTLTTPFAGSHGWYWRNDTDSAITISLMTKGSYKIIGLK